MKKKSPLPPGPTFTPRDVSLGLTSLEDVNYPLRWGVVGVGEISRQFVRSSRECPGATMAAAFSRSQDKADSFAASHGVEKGYDNLERLLDTPDNYKEKGKGVLS